MIRGAFWRTLAAAAVWVPAQSFAAQTPAPNPAIGADEYVQLEVQLDLSGTGPRAFDFCPNERLWEIDFRSLLGGAKQITLGVAIAGPGLPQTVLTPVSIERKQSGIFGTNRKCTVNISFLRYRTPIVSVRRHNGENFTVGPSYVSTRTVNPGVTETLTAALAVAATLANVPTESAAPHQERVQSFLGQIAIGHQQTLTEFIRIQAGPASAGDKSWTARAAVPAQQGQPARDLVLTARLIPIRSLIADPPRAANGAALWTPTAVLTAPFASLSPGLNPGGTLRGHVQTIASGALNNFNNAATPDSASIACDSLKLAVDGIGLSLRDTALLMWAITHDQSPRPGVTRYDIDRLGCLADSWDIVPQEIRATRVATSPVTVVDPPRPTLAPPTTRQMQFATQVDDAFARFFVVSAWTERRRHAVALFAYPVNYVDPGALILPSSSTVENPDQWGILHRDETPYLEKVGCYAYVPATSPTGSSLMYAIGELRGSGTQVLLRAAFAATAQDEARISGLTVSGTVTDEQRQAMRAVYPGGQCASGFRPALLFGS